MTVDLRADVVARIDLREVPFTLPLSRVLVLSDEDRGLCVHQVQYETGLAECTLVQDLRVRDPAGRCPSPSVCGASHLRWGQDGPVLSVTAQDEVLLGPVPAGWEISYRQGPLDPALACSENAEVRHGDGRIRVRPRGDEAVLVLWTTGAPPDLSDPLDVISSSVAHSQQLVDHWMARCPTVRVQDQSMASFCWWVLGVNTLRLGGPARGRVVVPSKIGYVGLWQWDAYFIAIGLRHGDATLAAEQLRLAVAHQGNDGQLPDVVHESGVLASSDDLPAADLASLRALGSPVLNQGCVPLTKPPLTALAVDLVAQFVPDDLVAGLDEAVAASQEWWFTHSDLDGDGVPEYLHPYSSGLDDSPVFDMGAPLESPDLTAYLCLQDVLLARWARRRGDIAVAVLHEDRAGRLRGRLAERLRLGAGWVPAVCEGAPSPHLTVLSLLAVLAPDVPRDLVDSVLTQLDDPARFGGSTPVPTVSRDDSAFTTQRMWRGPVWVNTNWLLSYGLRQQGESERADALDDATLRLVTESGGPSEYFDPDTRRRAPAATRCFGWSAALFIDLAVRRAGRGEPMAAESSMTEGEPQVDERVTNRMGSTDGRGGSPANSDSTSSTAS